MAVMTRYEFLTKAHEAMKPTTYLEVGVQLGGSLVVAENAAVAVGIDPFPQVLPHNRRPNQMVSACTADAYFNGAMTLNVDFAFIDGSHLFEDALRDFINIEKWLTDTYSVVFFDDVLPYSEAIATRDQPPGDWTGDVWKVVEILRRHREDLQLTLIDVAPTGLLMVQFWWQEMTPQVKLEVEYGKIIESWLAVGEAVPVEYITRSSAVSGDAALDLLSSLKG